MDFENTAAYFSEMLASAQDWAVSCFVEEHPDVSIEDVQFVQLKGNPFAYHIRSRFHERRWVHIEEGLPEEHRIVWLYSNNRHVQLGFMLPREDDKEPATWYSLTFENEVTAEWWMDMMQAPEPPAVEEDWQ